MIKNPILRTINNWFNRTFADPEAVSLFFVLIIGVLLLEFFSSILMPVLVSVVITYLLASPVRWLVRMRLPDLLAVIVVYAFFIGFFIYALVGFVPLMVRQLSTLLQVLPAAFTNSQLWANDILLRFPRVANFVQLQNVANYAQTELGRVGQLLVKISLATIPSVIEVILYFVLVPILVFFFLKDRKEISHWVQRFLPSHRGLMRKVWLEVNTKIGAYVRGRVLEIIIVSTVSIIAFSFLGLGYSVLLGAMVGVSVIIPYIGAVVAAIPILVVGLLQWGATAHFVYTFITYLVIIFVDAHILFPVLFSETMDLHPVVIILAVVFFGAMWGFWGIFFAIPLATLVNAVLRAWPRNAHE